MKGRRLLLCLMFVFCCGGCGNLIAKESEEELPKEHVSETNGKLMASGKAVEGEHYFLTVKRLIELPLSFHTGYGVAVHWKNRFRSLGKMDNGYSVFQSNDDFFTLDIYQLETGEKLKTIDLKERLEREYPGQQVGANLLQVAGYEGEPCIMFLLEDYPTSFEEGTRDTLKKGYLNIETEELYVVEYSLEQWKRELNGYGTKSREMMIFRDRNYHLLELNGVPGVSLGYDKYWEYVCWISMPITSLPEENQVLYGMFPQLKEIGEEVKQQEWGEDEPYVELLLTNEPTAEELVRMLLPEGQELSFEGMGISKYDSIDGEVHEIHSFEEYEEYLKPLEGMIDEDLVYPVFGGSDH